MKNCDWFGGKDIVEVCTSRWCRWRGGSDCVGQSTLRDVTGILTVPFEDSFAHVVARRVSWYERSSREHDFTIDVLLDVAIFLVICTLET